MLSYNEGFLKTISYLMHHIHFILMRLPLLWNVRITISMRLCLPKEDLYYLGIYIGWCFGSLWFLRTQKFYYLVWRKENQMFVDFASFCLYQLSSYSLLFSFWYILIYLKCSSLSKERSCICFLLLIIYSLVMCVLYSSLHFLYIQITW